DPLVAVDVADRAAAGGGVQEPRVVCREPGIVVGELDLAQVDRADRAILDGELVRVAGSVVGDGQGALRHANRPGKWLAKDNHGRTADGNGRTTLSFAVHMAQATAPKPASLYPTRSAAGALLGQQLAGRGYLGCLLLGITPEGVEIAANAAKAMGAQFDVLVAAFIKLGSNLAPIGAIAESAPSEMDPDFQPSGALMDKLASAIDESRARVSQDLILYRTERPVKKLAGHPLDLGVLRVDHVVLVRRVRPAAVAQPEMPRGKVQGISGEHVARPGPGVSGQYDRVDPAAPVDRRLRPNQPGVRGRTVRVVSTGHVHFD